MMLLGSSEFCNVPIPVFPFELGITGNDTAHDVNRFSCRQLHDAGFQGRTVVFTKKPAGSWLTERQPYVVDANGGKTVYFRNPLTGGGTFDDAWAIEQAEFAVQPAAGESPAGKS